MTDPQPPTLAGRVAVLEARTARHQKEIGLAQDGLALLMESSRAVTGELAEFRHDVAERFDSLAMRIGDLDRRVGSLEQRFDRQEILLTAIARQMGVDVPPPEAGQD